MSPRTVKNVFYEDHPRIGREREALIRARRADVMRERLRQLDREKADIIARLDALGSRKPNEGASMEQARTGVDRRRARGAPAGGERT